MIENDILINLNKKQVDEYSLVLQSQGIPHTLQKEGVIYNIVIDDEAKPKAELELLEYLATKEKTREKKIPKLNFSLTGSEAFIIPLLIAIFHGITLMTAKDIDWVLLGNASADHIMSGELFRAITALMLHADLKHLGLNMILLGIGAYAICSELGFGFGWLLILFSGFFGNLFNAYFYQQSHHSIGASTAVFGAIGIMVGLQIIYKYRKKRWVLLGASLAIFSFLGTSGERTDVAAHFFGLFAGIWLGILTSLFLVYYSKLISKLQYISFFTTIAIVTVSWAFALNLINLF